MAEVEEEEEEGAGGLKVLCFVICLFSGAPHSAIDTVSTRSQSLKNLSKLLLNSSDPVSLRYTQS